MLMKCLSTIGWIGEKTNTHQKMFSNNDLSCGHGHPLQVPVCQRKTLYFRESATLLSRCKCTVSLGTPLFLTSTPTLLYTTLHFCLLLLLSLVEDWYLMAIVNTLKFGVGYSPFLTRVPS